MADNQNGKIISDLALQVMRQSRNTLLIHLRFMDMAISRLSLAEMPNLFATDGVFLYYDPYMTLRNYRKELARPPHDYLHSILHCVFCHGFVTSAIDKKFWNLACDIAVEKAICELNLPAVAVVRQQKQFAVFADLEKKIGKLTAEKIYHYYKNNPPNPDCYCQP